jgi:glycosyltransferase involved in cell wall biosynthesis
VCFPPKEEDYGFVTAEAFASSKAVITCRDSGGPAELVEHNANGLICDPTPESLAAGLTNMMANASRAETMGKAARATANQMTWADAVRTLTALD